MNQDLGKSFVPPAQLFVRADADTPDWLPVRENPWHKLGKKRVYICSPPHLLYTRIVDDERKHERDIGMLCGLSFMEVCDEVWYYPADGITPGMSREIKHADQLGLPVQRLAPLPAEPEASE